MHGVVPLEEPRHTGAVDLHLQPADPERAEHALPLALGALVARLDALDAEWRHRVDVGQRLQTRVLRPHRPRHERDTGSAGRQADVGALERARDAGLIPRLARRDIDAEGRLQALARGPRPLERPRAQHDVRALAREQRRRPDADRSGAAQDHRPGPGERDHPGQARYRGGGGRVAAVGVHHRAHPEWAEEGFLDRPEQRFRRADVGASDPHRGVPEVGGPAREDGAVHQGGTSVADTPP